MEGGLGGAGGGGGPGGPRVPRGGIQARIVVLEQNAKMYASRKQSSTKAR